MEFVTKVVECVNTFLWDYALLVLLLGAGIIYSFSLKFIQIRKFGAGMKALFGNFSLHGGKGENGLSSFQALTTAIAAQVGTGNIAGAATAIASGGPGSIFWMWVSAFFGMATIYAEAVMAQHTRKLENGHYVGGPVYYIKYVFKGRFGKFLAGFFSVAIILALGFMGNMVQSNSIGAAFNNAFHVPKLAVGMMYIDENADLLDPHAWTKLRHSVLKTDEEKGIYGPGHNCFVKAEDGVTDLCVYHARPYDEIIGDPLYDPNRHARIMKVTYDEKGFPVFVYQKVEETEYL